MSTGGAPKSWRVEETDAGERLDRHAAARLSETRSRVQRWIRNGALRVDSSMSTATTWIVRSMRLALAEAAASFAATACAS